MTEDTPPIYTVLDAMIACGIDNVAMYEGQTAAKRVAADIFADNFNSCMDKSMDELQQDFKSYSDLTQAQGQTRFSPGIKRNVQALIQWVRDQYRLGFNPENAAFPVLDAANLIRRFKAHKQFEDISKTLSEVVKPEKFTDATNGMTGPSHS